MARRPGNTTNDQLLCWEQIDRTNRLFRISHAFAPREQAAKLLPLYALFSIVEEACSRFSDEQLAHSKLAWWRQELLGREPDPGSHPVIRELTRHAHLDDHHRRCMECLLEDAESRLDEPPPASLEDLRRRCAAVGQPQVELELRLCGFEGSIGAGHGARSGLVQLLRESLRAPEPVAFWWVPLDLLARHGVGRAEVRRPTPSGPAAALLKELLGHGRDWRDRIFAAPNSATGPRVATVRHLRAHDELQARLLLRLQGSSPDRYGMVMGRTSLTDLFYAWKSARRISRP